MHPIWVAQQIFAIAADPHPAVFVEKIFGFRLAERSYPQNSIAVREKYLIEFALRKCPGKIPGHSYKDHSKSSYSGMVVSGGLLVSLPEYPRFWLIWPFVLAKIAFLGTGHNTW